MRERKGVEITPRAAINLIGMSVMLLPFNPFLAFFCLPVAVEGMRQLIAPLTEGLFKQPVVEAEADDKEGRDS